LDYIFPEYAAAHPFEDGTAAILESSLHKTASGLGIDSDSYIKMFSRLVMSGL